MWQVSRILLYLNCMCTCNISIISICDSMKWLTAHRLYYKRCRVCAMHFFCSLICDTITISTFTLHIAIRIQTSCHERGRRTGVCRLHWTNWIYRFDEIIHIHINNGFHRAHENETNKTTISLKRNGFHFFLSLSLALLLTTASVSCMNEIFIFISVIDATANRNREFVQFQI